MGLEWVEPILEATSTLQVATRIVNIWSAPAKPVAESFHRIDEAYPGQFLLGIGVGHRERSANTASPTTRWSPTSTASTTTACPPSAEWLPRWARGYFYFRRSAAPERIPT